jgi:hypothetical protein
LYSLVGGQGDTDNASFNIVGNQILIATSPDFEIKSFYNIRLQTIDKGGLSFSKAFTISINNLALPPIPELSIWQENMKVFGKAAAERLENSSDFDQSLRNVYYDGALVFSQIAKYTGDNSWYSYADLANNVNKQYIADEKGRTQGFRNFSRGLEDHYYRTGDPTDREAIALLATSASYTAYSTSIDPLNDPTRYENLSREAAFGISTLLSAKQVGLFEENDRYFLDLLEIKMGISLVMELFQKKMQTLVIS